MKNQVYALNTNPYHIEIWSIEPSDAQGRLQLLRAGATLSEAKQAMRAVVMALNWKSYRCGVYLLKDGSNDWQELHEVRAGKYTKIV